MTLFNRILILFCLISCSHAVAHQDDVRVLLRKPLVLFDGNEEGRTHFLSDYTVRANFGSYFATDEFHSWRFGLGFDKGVLSFSDRAVWRFGLNLDTIADSDNSIGFRIAQTHYEVFSAIEFKIDESVAYVGYRHRCRHAADGTDARIIMKSGPEIGYNSLYHLGAVDLLWANSAIVYVYGQNDDLTHQPRVNVSSSAQVEMPITREISLFAGVGMSAIWVTEGTSRHFDLLTPVEATEFRFSPGASLGVNLKGMLGDVKAYLAYNSNLDAGFRSRAQRTHMISINGEVWY